MSDGLKTKLKTLTKDITEKLDGLESQVEHLKKGLKELLDEEDVRGLPSYGLLSNIYSAYLNSKPERSKTKEQNIEDTYDPLYMPAKMRKKTNARAKKQMVEAITRAPVPASPAAAYAKAETGSGSTPSYMPDFSCSLLEDMNKPKSQRPKAMPATKTLEVNVKEGETVYKLEIDGKEYLRYGKYLYDTTSHLRVGSIEGTCFALAASSVPISGKDTVRKHSEGYWIGKDSDEGAKVYVRVSDDLLVFQGVGNLTESGEIGLWA